MKWPVPAHDALIKRLDPPHSGRINMVLDTDTYNEVDDQFALAYSLLSPEKLDVQAVYAAPFYNDRSTGPEDGMEKSYDEIVRLLGKMNRRQDGFVFKGSRSYLKSYDTPVDSPAARDLIERAGACTCDDPLYVVAIGAITNVASAILMAPDIISKIAVVWLGGNPLDYPTTREFNLMQDIHAARVIFDCGAPVTMIPCMGVASHLLATVPELERCIGGKNALCEALVELFSAYSSDHFAWAKEIWDVSTIGYLVNPDWVPTYLAHSPLLTDDCHWAKDATRHMIRVAYMLNRNAIFKDMFSKLGKA